jgi:FdhE protein
MTVEVDYNRVANRASEHSKTDGGHMPINEEVQVSLRVLEEAEAENPNLSTYFEFHRTLFQILAQARADISATLELADEEALWARLLQGLPLLSFAQLLVEAEQFANLLSTVAQVLVEYDPELAAHAVPDKPAACLAMARQRYEAGQATKQQGQDHAELTLAELAVDLALKPHLEWAAEQILPHVDQNRWKRGYCPVCGGAPDFALLEETTGARHLLCSRCSSQWLYRRLECPFCGTSDHTKLAYHPSEDGVYRLYVCQQCKRYLKAIDLREVGRQVLFPVERVMTLSMDAAAQDAGYR